MLKSLIRLQLSGYGSNVTIVVTKNTILSKRLFPKILRSSALEKGLALTVTGGSLVNSGSIVRKAGVTRTSAACEYRLMLKCGPCDRKVEAKTHITDCKK